MRRILTLVVIAILAAVAVPSVLPQKTRASDAGARAVARTASTAAETMATEHGGSFATVTVASLTREEPSLGTCGQAPCLSAATGTRASYTVTARAASGDTFTITGDGTTAQRTCTGGGCRW